MEGEETALMWDRPVKSADEVISVVQASSYTATPRRFGRETLTKQNNRSWVGGVGGANLVQSPFGVAQEGDAVVVPDADGHGGEASGRVLPHGVRVQRRPAGHWTGGVVRAAGVRLHRVLCRGGGHNRDVGQCNVHKKNRTDFLCFYFICIYLYRFVSVLLSLYGQFLYSLLFLRLFVCLLFPISPSSNPKTFD